MQVFRKILALTLALTLTLSMGAVSVFAADTKASGQSSFPIGPSSLELVVGKTGELTANVTGLGTSGDITWKSGEEKIATVSSTGATATVKAVAVGTATITATATVPGVSGVSKTITGTCVVTVKAAPDTKPTDKEIVTAEAAKITTIPLLKEGDTTLTLPTVENGCSIRISRSGDLSIIALNGTITYPEAETNLKIVLEVRKGDETAETASLDVLVPARTAVDPPVDDKSGDNHITSFMIADSESKVDEISKTIAVEVPYNTDVTKLTPTIKINDKATVVPASGVVQDFTTPITYTVTAENGKSQPYVVTVTKKAAPTWTVTFDKNDGSAVVSIETTTGSITLPTAPTKAGYTFKGWFSDSYTKPFDGTSVTGNISVYAKWEAIATPPDNDKPSGGGGSNNTANKPETVEKVKDTVEALKDPAKALPADVAKTTTAGGKEISTIPVALTSGSASVGMDLFNTLGDSSSSVGLKFTVKAGLAGGSMEVIVPGGFGKITEPGRIGYSMDFADKAASNDDMLKAVKGTSVTSTTAKIGGNQTLPVTATITVATKVANGTTVNIYKYDPHTKKFIVIGKAIAKDGKLTFGTKIMGEMLFTTGTI